MRFGRVLTAVTLFSVCIPTLAASHARRGTTSLLARKHGVHTQSRPAGQRAIDDSRASEIQSALVGAGYLSGEPSGHWDTQTESAMQRFQADHGWQTRLMPDSRAIIKLGLGPKQVGTADPSSGIAYSPSAMAFSATH